MLTTIILSAVASAPNHRQIGYFKLPYDFKFIVLFKKVLE